MANGWIGSSKNLNEHHIKVLERANKIDNGLARVIALLIHKNIDLYKENAELRMELSKCRKQ